MSRRPNRDARVFSWGRNDGQNLFSARASPLVARCLDRKILGLFGHRSSGLPQTLLSLVKSPFWFMCRLHMVPLVRGNPGVYNMKRDQTCPDQASARRSNLFDLLRKQKLPTAVGRSSVKASPSGVGSLERARLGCKAALTNTPDASAERSVGLSDAFALRAFRDQAIASLYPSLARKPVSSAVDS